MSNDNNYSKTEIDLIIQGFKSETKVFFQSLLLEFKNSEHVIEQKLEANQRLMEANQRLMEQTQHKIELSQQDIRKDVNWLKVIVFASIITIIATKFFHI